MAFDFNSIAVKKCNVAKNAVTNVCKHINVNGVNVWNAEWVYFPNENTTVKADWSSSGGNWDVTEEYIYTYGSSAGSKVNLRNYLVDFSKYKHCYIEISAVNNNSQYDICWRKDSGGGIASRLRVLDIAAEQRVGVHHLDIEYINDLCYLSVEGDHGGGGYITRIWFEE